MPWKVDGAHNRTYLSALGSRLVDDRAEEGLLEFWGEWEGAKRVLRQLEQPSKHHPKRLWEPDWIGPAPGQARMNTDPCVFGGFFYSNCRQNNVRALRNLSVGSVVFFGTSFGPKGRQYFVLDTVFVVANVIPNWADQAIEDLPVSEVCRDVSLRPMMTIGNGCTVICGNGCTAGSAGGCKGPSLSLYVGATYEKPLDGMFSFFPCVSAGALAYGFPRPIVSLDSRLLNPASGRQAKVSSVSREDAIAIWKSLVDQVRDSGLDLGIWADLPKITPATP